MPKLRTDNGPQFIANRFERACLALGVVHERTRAKTPNLSYSPQEFATLMHAYREITRYMDYYNRSRKHGSLGCMAPAEYYRAFLNNQVSARSFVA
ncbi:MAG: integrase core domain-containing protein [Moorellales bacterium]